MHRYPPPASRPEPYAKPASQASDIAQNPYYARDARRNYPQTVRTDIHLVLTSQSVITQGDLSALLIAQPEGLALPPVAHAAASADKETRALTTADNAPSLSELFLAPEAASTVGSSLPPVAVPTAGDYVPTKVTLRELPRKQQPPSTGCVRRSLALTRAATSHCLCTRSAVCITLFDQAR